MNREEQAIHAIQVGMSYAPTSSARKIALGIYADLSDRKGIKNELVRCDKDVIDEMLLAWETIADVVIKGLY